MKTTVLLLLLIGCSRTFAQETPAGSKPNIVFILTDDQGYGDLGCFGATDIETPNLDRLATEGMKFESFYVHNRCSPTRAAFMTGSLAQRVGLDKVVYRKDRAGIHPDEVTVAELLQEGGYTTGIVGKWHLGEWDVFNPVHHGFDSFYGFMEYDDRKSTAIYRDTEISERIKGKTDGVHSPKLLQAGIEFIRAHQEEPFFLYYASPLPHTKWIPHEDFAGSSEQGTYGDVIQEIDWQVGALLDTLDELGLAEDTLVVFASDNGPQLNADGHGSSGPLRDGKWTNFEGGIRVPCLMRWPGTIPAGSRNDEITMIMDLLPTFCALAGVEVPGDRVLDGRNILPYLLGDSVPPIHDLFVVPNQTIRYQDWKLLLKGQSPGGKGNKGMQGRVPAPAGSLFHLGEDLGERNDVSGDYPERVEDLTRMMEEFVNELKQNQRPAGTVPLQGHKKAAPDDHRAPLLESIRCFQA